MEENNQILYRLLINTNGYGNKGDTVKFLRQKGDLVLVDNGIKQFLIERNNLTICPQFPLMTVQT